MKNCFLLLLFIQFTPTSGWTQIELENQSLKEPTLKLLYAGAENKIVLTHTKKKNPPITYFLVILKRLSHV